MISLLCSDLWNTNYSFLKEPFSKRFRRRKPRKFSKPDLKRKRKNTQPFDLPGIVITVLKSITSIFLLFTRLILISCTFTQKEHSALDFCLFLMCLYLEHHLTTSNVLVFFGILCGYLTDSWIIHKNLESIW